MEQLNLDPRLAAFLPLIEELKALRNYLLNVSATYASQNGVHGIATDGTYAGDSGVRPLYWLAIKWIDDALLRIEPELHSRRWPPVWWRLSGVNIDAVFHNFHRADTDGYFYEPDPEHPGFGKGYVPERDKIMAWIDRINEAYTTAQQAR